MSQRVGAGLRLVAWSSRTALVVRDGGRGRIVALVPRARLKHPRRLAAERTRLLASGRLA